jgi:hypothetical protein
VVVVGQIKTYSSVNQDKSNRALPCYIIQQQNNAYIQMEAMTVLALVLRRFDVSITQDDLKRVRAVEAILYTPNDVMLTLSQRGV